MGWCPALLMRSEDLVNSSEGNVFFSLKNAISSCIYVRLADVCPKIKKNVGFSLILERQQVRLWCQYFNGLYWIK